MAGGGNKPNLLLRIWVIVSTIFGAIGLVNVTEDVYKWGPFFEHLIDHYVAIWYWFFNWLPFYVPDWLRDYLFFGTILSSSYFKLLLNITKGQKDVFPVRIVLFLLVWTVLIWPLSLIQFLMAAFIPISSYEKFRVHTIFDIDDPEGYLRTKESSLWLVQLIGAILFVFLLFLMVNISLEKSAF